MNPVQVKIDDFIATLVEVPATQKIAITAEISAFRKTNDPSLGDLSVFSLLRHSLISLEGDLGDGTHKKFLFNGDTKSNFAILGLMRLNHRSLQKVVEVAYQAAMGKRASFHDYNGNPIPGVSVVSNLSLLN